MNLSPRVRPLQSLFPSNHVPEIPPRELEKTQDLSSPQKTLRPPALRSPQSAQIHRYCRRAVIQRSEIQQQRQPEPPPAAPPLPAQYPCNLSVPSLRQVELQV